MTVQPKKKAAKAKRTKPAATVPTCLACGRGASETPLLRLSYRSSGFSICPQHLPILIHRPHDLIGKLPGAERLVPADHHD